MLPYLILLAALAVTLALFTALARWSRKRGTAGAALGDAMAAYNEAYHTTAYSAHQEQQSATTRKAAQGSPNDL
ncbi:hypothetical protein Kfla_3780 [Kribbella flavida DSM 17836]|uniref:Secreted protein n=1 Tax=Kribbella flavida (strain DSM 17836 / JCM 10339 / NBRC 14399) TaxID=479435 RepID=D2PP16_KRIFD|nr:hypothetical protein [Kribbella flavida]ADB32834.1 hypothetical protein Kfla_3780 [Kribbella flavida DSM 17836]